MSSNLAACVAAFEDCRHTACPCLHPTKQHHLHSGAIHEPTLRIITPVRPFPSSLAKAWVDALDQIGFPFCVTHIVVKNDKPVNITFVHPGGVTAGSTGATRT